jgi:hypothetical protein
MHDIAVVTLDSPVTFVPPVRLGFGMFVNSGNAAGVVGWGYSGLLLRHITYIKFVSFLLLMFSAHRSNSTDYLSAQ